MNRKTSQRTLCITYQITHAYIRYGRFVRVVQYAYMLHTFQYLIIEKFSMNCEDLETLAIEIDNANNKNVIVNLVYKATKWIN